MLKEIGVPPEKIAFVPDIAIPQEQISRQQAQVLLEEFAGQRRQQGRLIAVIPAIFDKPVHKHIKVLARSLRVWLEKNSDDRVLVFIGNRRGGGICECNDDEAAGRLFDLVGMDDRIVSLIDIEFSLSQLKGMFAELDLVISCRLHAAILSTMAGTPAITLAIQPKTLEYMSLCNQEQFAYSLKGWMNKRSFRQWNGRWPLHRKQNPICFSPATA